MNTFDLWNQKKRKIDSIVAYPYFHDREIWFCHLGKNVGHEEDGKGKDMLRPVLIYKKFNKQIFFGIPLSTTTKKGKYYFSFKFKSTVSNALLSQFRLFDAKRLSHKMGKMSKGDFSLLKEKFTLLVE